MRYLSERDAVEATCARHAADAGPFYAATKETLINRQYPLGRIIPAEIDRVPGQPVDPKVKEFLRYILSREGQEDIVRNGKYLPMQPEAAKREPEKLELSALTLGRAKSVDRGSCLGGVLRIEWRAAGQLFVPPAALEGGVIRSWGDDALGGVMGVLQDGFRRYHPEVTFQNTLLRERHGNGRHHHGCLGALVDGQVGDRE